MSFRSFAVVCITRQILTAIRTATRPRHQPLNQYVSISGGRIDDPGARGGEELLISRREVDPADVVVASERMQSIRNSVAERLSGLEVDVLYLWVEGRSYQEIGDQLGRHPKSIDNTVQRIKRKLDHYLRSERPGDSGELESRQARRSQRATPRPPASRGPLGPGVLGTALRGSHCASVKPDSRPRHCWSIGSSASSSSQSGGRRFDSPLAMTWPLADTIPSPGRVTRFTSSRHDDSSHTRGGGRARDHPDIPILA